MLFSLYLRIGDLEGVVEGNFFVKFCSYRIIDYNGVEFFEIIYFIFIIM